MSITPEAEIQRLTIALRLLRRKLDVPGLPDALNVDARCLLDIADDAACHCDAAISMRTRDNQGEKVF